MTKIYFLVPSVNSIRVPSSAWLTSRTSDTSCYRINGREDGAMWCKEHYRLINSIITSINPNDPGKLIHHSRFLRVSQVVWIDKFFPSFARLKGETNRRLDWWLIRMFSFSLMFNFVAKFSRNGSRYITTQTSSISLQAKTPEIAKLKNEFTCVVLCATAITKMLCKQLKWLRTRLSDALQQVVNEEN